MRRQYQVWSRFMQVLALAAAVNLIAVMSSFSAQKNVVVNISQEGVSCTGAPQITYMQLRVADPSGQIIYQNASDGATLTWSIPAGSPDGFYSYEVRLATETKKEKRAATRSNQPKVKAMVESGRFLIENGSVAPQVKEETGMLDSILSIGSYALNSVLDFLVTPAAADQVILDDLVVDGSACVGTDCINNEVFDFDTIRLKENNLRIKFQDTSNSGSFPSTDWQIIINDSINGGASYFGVEDVDAGRIPFRVEAGAPNNTLYVKNSGRIGIGTSTPAVELHVVDGNTPTLRFDQDGSGGWFPQVWDLGGNETNFFVRDVTNSYAIPFKIFPGTPENTLTMTADGRVGINTASPARTLHVNGDAQIDGDAFINGIIVQASSRELKRNIESLDTDEAVMTVAMLRPVKFQYKRAPDEETIGFIAEEVPELVATNNRKGVSSMDVVAVLTKVVQEQQKAIEELNKTVARLEAKLEGKATE